MSGPTTSTLQNDLLQVYLEMLRCQCCLSSMLRLSDKEPVPVGEDLRERILELAGTPLSDEIAQRATAVFVQRFALAGFGEICSVLPRYADLVAMANQSQTAPISFDPSPTVGKDSKKATSENTPVPMDSSTDEHHVFLPGTSAAAAAAASSSTPAHLTAVVSCSQTNLVDESNKLQKSSLNTNSTSKKSVRLSSTCSAKELHSPSIPRAVQPLISISHHSPVTSVLFESDTHVLFTASKGRVHVSQLSCLKTTPSSSVATTRDVYSRSLVYEPTSRALYTSGECNLIEVFDSDAKGELALRSSWDSERAQCFATVLDPGQHFLLYTAHGCGDIVCWDSRHHSPIRSVQAHPGGTLALKAVDDGVHLVSGGRDSFVRVWDHRKLNQPLQTTATASPVLAVSVCPNDSWVLAGMENSQAMAFTTADRSIAFQLELHSDSILDVGYSHSAAWMYTTGKDSNINLWKAPIGTSILQIREPGPVIKASVSVNDRYLATASATGTATVYTVEYVN